MSDKKPSRQYEYKEEYGSYFPYPIHMPTEIYYCFSTHLRRQKFRELKNTNRITTNERITKRYGIDFKNDLLSDLYLYRTIEHDNGIKIIVNGRIITEWDRVKLDGAIMTNAL